MRYAICLVVLLLCSSCGLPEAERAAHAAICEAIAPEYESYVGQDPELTEAQRERRLETVRQWRKLVGR